MTLNERISVMEKRVVAVIRSSGEAQFRLDALARVVLDMLSLMREIAREP